MTPSLSSGARIGTELRTQATGTFLSVGTPGRGRGEGPSCSPAGNFGLALRAVGQVPLPTLSRSTGRGRPRAASGGLPGLGDHAHAGGGGGDEGGGLLAEAVGVGAVELLGQGLDGA